MQKVLIFKDLSAEKQEHRQYLPIKSAWLIPRFSPLIVTLVPGGPSLGETPVTFGGLTFPILFFKLCEATLQVFCLSPKRERK